jgi:hypothetical protein
MRLFEPLIAHEIFDEAFDDDTFGRWGLVRNSEPIPRHAPSGTRMRASGQWVPAETIGAVTVWVVAALLSLLIHRFLPLLRLVTPAWARTTLLAEPW